MRLGTSFIVGAALVVIASSTAWADVKITMQDGKVSIVAKDATLRQIMTEWARVGQTKIVNVERIPGGPMTLELRDMPEDRALDVLMRSLSGYVAAPRAQQVANLSRFDRILVMPTMAAARQPAMTTGAAAPPPTFPTGAPAFQQVQEDADEPPAPNPGGRGPVFSAFPQPQVVNPNGVPGNGQQPTFVPPPGMNLPGAQTTPPQSVAPSNVPTAPPGVSVPGMMVPTPGAPGQTPGTVRRPGGGL